MKSPFFRKRKALEMRLEELEEFLGVWYKLRAGDHGRGYYKIDEESDSYDQGEIQSLRKRLKQLEGGNITGP